MNHEAKLRVPVTDADHDRGPKNAPLVLVEYGDYQCPHCGRAYPITERLRKTLNGDLRFVFRNFPMSEAHPDAMNAARAAEAAANQGRFWEMHGMLFANQGSLDEESLYAYAKSIRLDESKFAGDMEGGYADTKIMADFRGGVRSGVNGTPTFFVNGMRYDGDWSFEPFLQTLIEVGSLKL